MSELFVKEPHWITDFLEQSDMNMTQARIFHVVKRLTFGFHKDHAWCTQSFLSLRTGCNQRQVARELKRMVDRGILLEWFEGKNRCLKINPKLKELFSYDSLDIPSYDSLDIVDYDSLDTHIKKDIKEKDIKETIYIILPNDVAFINIYLKYFKKKKRRTHPRVTEDQLGYINNQIEHMQSFDLSEEDWEEGIKEHFDDLPAKNNGNIIAFLKASHRYYEIAQYDRGY